MLTLELKNSPPENYVNGVKYFNFTMMLHGNVFESSPGAQGFFEMPQACSYERNHSVLAMFNASSGDVEFEILDTHSDKIGCFNFGSAGQTLNRCAAGRCYSALNGMKFEGRFRLGPKRTDDAPLTVHHLEMVLYFPYKHFGKGAWADFIERKKPNYVPVRNQLTTTVSSWNTRKASQIFRFSLTPSPQKWMGPTNEWFRDRKPKILSVHPPFGPEEGGSIVTVRGVEFPEPDEGSSHNASITLRHNFLTVDGVLREWGGQVRECCATRRVSDTEMTCRLPRISCLHSNSVGKCSKPGAEFANQTVSLAIKPSIKGYYPGGSSIPAEYNYPPPFQTSYPNGLDDFVSYEGEWELEDNDVYGGTFVRVADRIPGETHILNADQATASGGFCCPVCKSDRQGRDSCRLRVIQVSAGIYNVTIPALLYPGGVGRPVGGSGVCDTATNFKNSSLEVGIERSTDPTGFTPLNPLSVTSCIDMRGTCATSPRVSIREMCKQLIWSTGVIVPRLPLGQTVEVYEWESDGKCDRRMRCVGGPCMWTNLASDDKDNTPEGTGEPLFQRREASPQVGLEMQYKNDDFSADGFLAELAKLILDQDTDPRRLQIVHYAKQRTYLPLLDNTFSALNFQPSESALCIPESGYPTCVDYNLILHIISDGPLGDNFNVPLNSLLQRARSQQGDPEFHKLNLMVVCVDLSWQPDAAAQNLPPDCIIVQYPNSSNISNAPVVYIVRYPNSSNISNATVEDISSEIGGSKSNECPAGAYIATGSWHVFSYFWPFLSWSCTLCPAGKFAYNAGSSECDLCPSGSFTLTMGSTSCTPCASGWTTVSVGATECTIQRDTSWETYQPPNITSWVLINQTYQPSNINSTWGNIMYAHCDLNLTLKQLRQGYKDNNPPNFRTGGLGPLMQPDLFEVWVCVENHFCSTHPTDHWFCWTISESIAKDGEKTPDQYVAWGPNAVLGLVKMVPESQDPHDKLRQVKMTDPGQKNKNEKKSDVRNRNRYDLKARLKEAKELFEEGLLDEDDYKKMKTDIITTFHKH